MLRFAINVARRITRDTEGESAAGNALARALRTYDGRVHIHGWITVCVRREVYCALRKMYRPRRKEFGDVGAMVTNYYAEDASLFDMLPGREAEPNIDSVTELLDEETTQLLYDRYVYEHSYKHMADERGITWYQLRLRLQAAVSRLRQTSLADAE